MANRRRGSSPPPPGAGSYEFEVIELGPAVYFTPHLPVKTSGMLVPVGDDTLLPRPTPGASPRADGAEAAP